MESQPQNPEFRYNPENFHPCICKKSFFNSSAANHDLILSAVIRAAMFTRVNGTVSCFCNKRLQKLTFRLHEL